MTIIWWLRRDIRLDDNSALADAFRQSNGAVIPVFIVDPAILAAPDVGAARVQYLMTALHELEVLVLRTRQLAGDFVVWELDVELLHQDLRLAGYRN